MFSCTNTSLNIEIESTVNRFQLRLRPAGCYQTKAKCALAKCPRAKLVDFAKLQGEVQPLSELGACLFGVGLFIAAGGGGAERSENLGVSAVCSPNLCQHLY